MTPPKDQAPGLVARLRAQQTAGDLISPDPYVIEMTYVYDPLTTEAAHRIEQLEAHAEQGWHLVNHWMARYNEVRQVIEQLEAENAELRAKLGKTARRVYDLEGALARIEADDAYLTVLEALTEQANIRSPVQSEMAKMVDPRKDEN